MKQLDHIKFFKKVIENKRRVNFSLLAEESGVEYSFVWRLVNGERGIRETEHSIAAIKKIIKALKKHYPNVLAEVQEALNRAA